MRNPAKPSSVRINNQRLMIEYLRAYGPQSRADLSKALAISKPSISTNVEGLLAKGILIEIGSGASSGGRIPTLIAFNSRYKCIMAIDLNRSKPLIALGNLDGEIVDSMAVDVALDDDKAMHIKKLTGAIDDLLGIQGYLLTDLGVISVAIPGVVDEDTGRVFAHNQFKTWTKLNLKDILQQAYKVDVVMKNDISMAALGECHHGCGIAYEDMAYVSVGLGVGAGLILRNQLFEGHRKAAGEIGYSRILGHPHTIEDQVSIPKLWERIKSDLALGQETCLQTWLMSAPLDMALLVRAAHEKDAYVLDLLESIGQVLGTAVANMALVLDLELIVIGGSISELGPYLMKHIIKTCDEILPFETHIKVSDLSSMAGLYGLVVLGEEIIVKGLVD